jgi:hypothetical protein
VLLVGCAALQWNDYVGAADQLTDCLLHACTFHHVAVSAMCKLALELQPYLPIQLGTMYAANQIHSS